MATDKISTLYPYPFKVIQVKVKPAWMLQADAHAAKEMERKKTAKPSSWDVCQRLGEIAFGAKYGILDHYPTIGKRCPPFLFVRLRISVHTSPFDERYKTGNEMSLKVIKEYCKKAQVHVLAAYDPPFVDLIGWETLATIMEAPDNAGRTNMSASTLRPMSELPGYVKS